MINPIKNILQALLILFSVTVFSQITDSTYIHNQHIKIATLNRDGNFDQAYQINNLLLSQLLKDHNDTSEIAQTYFYKSSIEINLGKYNESIKSAHKSLNLFILENDSLKIASSLNLIGVGFYFLSNYDSTKIYYEKSYELKKKLKADSKKLAISSYNLALAYEDLEETDKALELYKQAETYLLQDKENLSFLSDVYVGIAHLYFYNKDIDNAEKYAEKALDEGLKSYGEFNPNMTFVYTSYANILESKKKYEESISLLKKSLNIRENTYGKYHKWTCESYYDLANAYALDKQFEQAEKHFEKAIEIGEKSNSFQYLSNAKTALAKMYCNQNQNNDKAEELLINALQYKLSVFGSKNEIVAENYLYLAQNAVNNNDEDSFFKYINLTLAASNYNKENLFNLVAPFVALDAMVIQGDWYQNQFKETNNIELLKEKYNLIDQELRLIRFSQMNFSSERSKISFANDYRKVFEKGLNTCWELYQNTNDEEYLEKAFELSETNRNTTLLEGMQDSQFKLFGDIPEELLQFEKQIKKELAKVKKDLYYENNSSNPNKEILSDLLDKRIKVSSKLDSLQSKFSLSYPKYKSLKYQNKIIKIADVQKELDKKNQLITYFLGDNNLYTFTITRDHVTFQKNEHANAIVKEIDKLKEGLITQENINEASTNLYKYLLKDNTDLSINNLIIIPDNVLNYIPFETLQNDKNKYLIENFTVSYSGSTRLFLELNNDYFNYKLPNYWVGFSPQYDNDKQLSSIKGETEDISKLVDGKSFIGTASTKENFFLNNMNHSILHLAMHAEIDNKNPMYNKLIFSDGDLTSSEIYVSNSKANLAVLSACNTGFGKLEKGEGVMSMARAFHFSGVPSILMSLWKVPDKETKIIMVAFYKNLKKGMSKNKALHEAKHEYLSSTNDITLKHPYYWSGFVLTGNNQALSNNNTNNYVIGSFLSILLLLIIYIKIYK
ncbi:MAG: CHAT domain-containing tetratricopeptide repeat protein [Bacteroidota bacterium]